MSKIGKISSFQSLGTVDGPGIRSVVFMQGCPLRCICCHNPETLSFDGGEAINVNELFKKIIRFKVYYGKTGGVTFSGGEPLMQPDFLIEICKKLKAAGIHIALDTSGCILNDKIKKLLSLIDLVLLDVKYYDNESYKKNAGMSLDKAIEFLNYLNEQNIDTYIRRVIIPGFTDNEMSIEHINSLKEKYPCIKKVELLPFHNLCIEKYENMGLEFKLKDTPTPTSKKMEYLNSLLK